MDQHGETNLIWILLPKAFQTCKVSKNCKCKDICANEPLTCTTYALSWIKLCLVQDTVKINLSNLTHIHSLKDCSICRDWCKPTIVFVLLTETKKAYLEKYLTCDRLSMIHKIHLLASKFWRLIIIRRWQYLEKPVAKSCNYIWNFYGRTYLSIKLLLYN